LPTACIVDPTRALLLAALAYHVCAAGTLNDTRLYLRKESSATLAGFTSAPSFWAMIALLIGYEGRQSVYGAGPHSLIREALSDSRF